MIINHGASLQANSIEAVEESTADWTGSPDLILLFCSTQQCAGEVAAEFRKRFPSAIVVGCTTTGEQLNGKHLRGSLVAVSIESDHLEWSPALLPDLNTLDEERVNSAVDYMFANLNADPHLIDVNEYFCLCFVDGLSMREESLSSWLADALEGVPLVGGSAGDDLHFVQTQVILNDRSYSNSAVLLLARSKLPFRLLKHQQFQATNNALVVTKADPATRRIIELDGMPAITAYADALGLQESDITGGVIQGNPVVFSTNGDLYVRSIRQIETDGSISFFCAVEEGMVLQFGEDLGLLQSIEVQLEEFKKQFGRADLLISFNCVLRALETAEKKLQCELERTYQDSCKTCIGFDTYGEQFNGLHINQTLVGLALRSEGGQLN